MTELPKPLPSPRSHQAQEASTEQEQAAWLGHRSCGLQRQLVDPEAKVGIATVTDRDISDASPRDIKHSKEDS